MKIKKKKVKKNKNGLIDTENPGEKTANNPANDDVISTNGKKRDLNEIQLSEQIKKPKKKKIKKLKKPKKVLKLKGKKKRAISNAVLEQINDERSNSMNSSNFARETGNSISLNKNSAESNDNNLVQRNFENISENEAKTVIFQKPRLPSIIVVKSESEEQSTLVPKTKKVSRKPSEGDLKALRKKREKQKVESLNPFENSESADEIGVLPEKGMSEVKNRSHSKRHRTSSMLISSKERRKKKRHNKILKKFKKKKKSKGKQDPALSYNPKPPKQHENPNRISEMTKETNQVKEIMTNQVKKELEKRDSKLSEVMDTVEFLEEASHKFAKTTQQISMKKQTQAGCCGGFFSKYRICWYICTCKRGVKRKKKYKSSNKEEIVNIDSRACSAQSDDDGDAYSVQGSSNEVTQVRTRGKTKTDKESSSPSELKRLMPGEKRERRTSSSSLFVTLHNNKLLQNFGSTRSLNMTDSRKKSSPTGSLQDIIQRKPNVNKKTEKRISQAVLHYEDPEMKKSAVELLLMDHEKPAR